MVIGGLQKLIVNEGGEGSLSEEYFLLHTNLFIIFSLAFKIEFFNSKNFYFSIWQRKRRKSEDGFIFEENLCELLIVVHERLRMLKF